MAPEHEKILRLLQSFEAQNISVSSLLLHVLSDSTGACQPFLTDLRRNAPKLISQLLHLNPKMDNLEVGDSLFEALALQAQAEVKSLILNGSNWQFGVSSASAQQLDNFRLELMAKEISEKSPHLWSLLDMLLSATKKHSDMSNSTEELTNVPSANFVHSVFRVY
ncbi:hypothetical protein H0H92_010661 [Tricholoma furcatifolium]|nr:hypothetical protein H0H92_010661 [Tricholoma furcatifolium]